VGVRLHAGHQAVALNAIISELPQSHPLLQAAASGSGNTENGRTMLREKLGHTPQQVNQLFYFPQQGRIFEDFCEVIMW